MTRTTINFILDVLLLIVFLLLLWSSVIVRFVFPLGESARWILWGWHFEDWVHFQFILICLLAFEVLLHLMLHWTWICGVIASYLARRSGKKPRWDDGIRTLYGVGTLIVALHLVGAGIAAAWLMIQPPPGL